jgi:hypothetical protein
LELIAMLQSGMAQALRSRRRLRADPAAAGQGDATPSL